MTQTLPELNNVTEPKTGYVTRSYREGDEKELSDLFNRAYSKYAGFVPRTPEYWLWCCLNRPDVEVEGILIVSDKRNIVGYGVVGKTGNVWELCYDSNYDGKLIVSTILEWIVNYVTAVGSDSISLNSPIDDQIIREVCSKFGFAETRPSHMFLSVLNFSQFIDVLFKSANLDKFNEGFVIELIDSPSWCDQTVTVNAENRKAHNAEKKLTIVETDVTTLVSCFLGTNSLLKAFIRSKFKVKPFSKSYSIYKLFSSLKLKDPWFCPRADFG